MKYLFLFISLTYPLSAMEITKNKPSTATLKCLQGIKDLNETMVKEAFSEGADVNYADENNQSLFALAAGKDNWVNNKIICQIMPILKLIVSQKNINPFTRNFNNCTPLNAACQFGIIETIQEILKKAPGALFLRNKQGHTPLHAAALFKQTAALDFLLSHDKKIINLQDYEGNTALHMACERNNFDIIERNNFDIIALLINNGACTTIKSYSQKTPLYVLCSACYPRNMEKLEMFFKDNPFIAEKLIHATDEQNNNQFHLCTTLELFDFGMGLEKYLSFLVTKAISIHERNNQGKRAVDLIYGEYLTSYNQYISRKTIHQKEILLNIENNMHSFLRFFSPFTESVLLKNILEKKDKYKQPLLREIKAYIAYLYYALNIETIIAKKHMNDSKYYNDFIENKMAIKQKLIQNPEPHLLWSA